MSSISLLPPAAATPCVVLVTLLPTLALVTDADIRRVSQRSVNPRQSPSARANQPRCPGKACESDNAIEPDAA